MSLQQRIEQNQTAAIYIAAAIYLFINNTINASSVWLEHTRGGTASIHFWEPFAWEYTSAFSTLVLLPGLFYVFRRQPPTFTKLKQQFAFHLLASCAFSLLHVMIMVACREVIYFSAGGNYEFGPWLRELWYEFRKDLWSYVSWYFVFHSIGFVYSRIKGEATPISHREEKPDQESAPEHFLVKKLDKAFLVKVESIEWLESSGNYVNLHSNGRIYPLRSTLNQLCTRLDAIGFSRIHRSHAINHNAIASIRYLPSGDGEIELTSGTTLNLSRRYKEAFKQKLC